MHKLENEINGIVSNLLNDYSQGKDIDRVSSFDHPYSSSFDKSPAVTVLSDYY